MVAMSARVELLRVSNEVRATFSDQFVRRKGFRLPRLGGVLSYKQRASSCLINLSSLGRTPKASGFESTKKNGAVNSVADMSPMAGNYFRYESRRC
jgi:hypothetical protein